MKFYMLGITIATDVICVFDPDYMVHVCVRCSRNHSLLHSMPVCTGMQPSRLTNACVSHKLLTQWLDWCNDSGDGRYSSDDYGGTKTINVCIRFIKCNPCTERLHLVLFHHSVLKLGEVLGKLVLIEKYWALIYFSNKSFYPPSGSFRHHFNLENKQKKKVTQTLSLIEPNLANHVWTSWLFFHFLSSHQQ